MTVILNQKEIRKAVEVYLKHNGLSLEDKIIDIKIRVGRSGNESMLEVDIDDIETAEPIVQNVVTVKEVEEQEDSIFGSAQI